MSIAPNSKKRRPCGGLVLSQWKQARWPFVAFVLIEVVIFGSGSAVTKFAYESITPL